MEKKEVYSSTGLQLAAPETTLIPPSASGEAPHERYFRIPNLFIGGLEARIFQKVLRILNRRDRFLLVRQDNNALSEYWKDILAFLKREAGVSGFRIRPAYNDVPRAYSVSLDTRGALHQKDTDGQIFSEFVGNSATSENFTTALSKATGEFLERLSFLLYREKNFLRASPSVLKQREKKFLDLRCLNVLSEGQKKKHPYLVISEQDEFMWVRGVALSTRQEILLPAQTIYWNYNRKHTGWTEKFLRETNTSGCAGGRTLNEALLGAIYESIERDAFLVHWMNGVAPRSIDPHTVVSPSLQTLLAKFQRYNLDVHLLDTTTDCGIPSCIVAVVDRTKVGPSLAIGGKAGSCWESILKSALMEALSVYTWARRLHDSGKPYPTIASPEDPSLLSFTLQDRVLLWSNPDMLSHFEFFLSGNKVSFLDLQSRCDKIFSTEEEELHFLQRTLANQGHHIYYFQAQNDLVDQLHFRVVRALIPSLLPMYFNELTAPWGSPRLQQAAQSMRLVAPKKNTWPHPFP